MEFVKKDQLQSIKEKIIREQLIYLLPKDIELIDIIFCAHELCKQIVNSKTKFSYE